MRLWDIVFCGSHTLPRRLIKINSERGHTQAEIRDLLAGSGFHVELFLDEAGCYCIRAVMD